MTATINGEDFTAETTTGVFTIINVEFGSLGVQETKNLTITGTIPSLTNAVETITLIFACSEFTSDLNIVDTDSDCGIGMNYTSQSLLDPNNSTVVMAIDDGQINVEEVTEERIRGTFSFSGEDQNGSTINITNGFFDTSILQ